MLPTQLFNFTTFKSVMEIPDIDDSTYAYILRAIFDYLKRYYNIDIFASGVLVPEIGSTATSIIVPVNALIEVGQIVSDGVDERQITSVVSDLVYTTFTVDAFSSIPTSLTIQYTQTPFDLQYAIFLHAKFMFESQKKNTNIIDSVTDASGNKASYKAKLPTIVTSTYLEYSKNEVAFV